MTKFSVDKFLLTTPESKKRANKIIGTLWLLFGFYGLFTHLSGVGYNVADSVPILFFISVYAITIAHYSTASSQEVETKVDELNVDTDNLDVDVEVKN